MIDFILTMALSSVFALEFTDMDGTDAKKSTAKKGVTGRTTYSPRNSNNINLNRDWIETPKSQEIRNIKSLLALIRMGISDRKKIAKILNMSVNTVYTYHTYLQQHSIFDSADFDHEVKKL